MLSAQGLTLTFNPGTPIETRALRGLSLEIPTGQFVAVIGSNGAGKSTFLNSISGDQLVDSGSITINGEEHILLDYLAVDSRQRGTGIGSEILQLMRRHYAGKGVFLEIESVYEDCGNKDQRIRRKHFYEKCGMTSMEVFVWLFGVKMELMGFDCSLTYEQYHAFYRDNYNQWAADHIQKAEK